MNFSTEEREIGRADYQTLRGDLGYFKPGLPQFGAYADITGKYLNQNPIPATFPGILATSTKYVAQSAVWTGTTFAGSLLGNAFNFSKGTLGTVKWHGAVGMRWMFGAPANFIAGAARSIPGIGKVTGGIADAANAFTLGGEWATADVMGRISGVGRRHYAKFFDTLSKGVDTKVSTWGGGLHIETGLDAVKIQGNAFQKLSQLKKLNLSAEEIATLGSKAGMTTEQAASALKWTKFGVGASAVLSIVQGVSIGVQAGQFIGNVVGGMVKTGYDLSETMGRQTKTLMNRARTVEFGGDISAFMTQAAVTERTRALQFMQNARVNGAYMYGNETNYI